MNRVHRCHRLLNVPNGHPANGARVFTKRQGAVAPRRRFDSNLDSACYTAWLLRHLPTLDKYVTWILEDHGGLHIWT